MSATSTRRKALVASMLGVAAAAAGVRADASQPRPHDIAMTQVRYKTVDVDGLSIFYREAGPPGAPAVLLLHGFPSSSHMFRDLIPRLAERYRVVAPDYPGFGHSAFPAREDFTYSFASITGVIDRFVQTIGLARYALYIQDYGAPVGLRLALLHPERVSTLVVQNGNAYEEGLSGDWDPLKAYWKSPTAENRAKLRGWLSPAGTQLQYTAGLPAALRDRLSPDTWTLDWALLSRPGNIDLQLDLFGDYQTNVALYPRFQDYLRRYKPPTLVVWGRHDPFFTEAGAKAYRRDVAEAEIHLLETGHFALETHAAQIADLMLAFLGRGRS